MSIVTLMSGGLDSTVVAVLAHEEGVEQFPLFIDYGQLNRERELAACRHNLRHHGLPDLTIVSVPGLGALLPSGLTDPSRHIVDDAFLPGRNIFFLTIAGAFAFRKNARAVAIGLLSEAFSLFPDQTRGFLNDTETLLRRGLGRPIAVLAPLMSFSKAEVVSLAKAKGISATYSCHAGKAVPCGNCIACREYIGLEV